MSITFKGTEKIWMDGKLVNFEDAKIHVLSHVVHYGTSIFEGIRAYETPKGTAIFRLKDHVNRLFQGIKIYRMDYGEKGFKYTKEEVIKAIKETVKANNFKSCYIRPIVYRGYGTLGVSPFEAPVHMAVAACQLGYYLEGADKGVRVMVSSWRRMAPDTLPALAKAGSNYMNSQLVKMEALLNGYIEGIALDYHGYVSEGSGENLFVVRNGTLITTPLSGSILEGITRDTIIKLAKDEGIPVVERFIAREELYIADELFFTGTAAEITPIIEVDKIKIGSGKPGEITLLLKQRFFEIINLKRPDRYGWLDFLE